MDFVLDHPTEPLGPQQPLKAKRTRIPRPVGAKVTCPCCDYGFELSAEGKPRSYPQLQRYHSMIRDAYFHWPDNHPRIKFSGLDDAGLPLKGALLARQIFQCRKYLEIRCGYRDLVMRIPVLGMDKSYAKMLVQSALIATFRGEGGKGSTFAYPEIEGDEMLIWRSRSIAYEKLKHKEACELFDAVEELIYAETGRRLDDKGFSQIELERRA